MTNSTKPPRIQAPAEAVGLSILAWWRNLWPEKWQRDANSRPRRSLASIVTSRVAIAALLAFILQAAICMVENFSDDDYLGRGLVRLEVQRLAETLSSDGGRLVLAPDRLPSHYKGPYARLYSFRVLSSTGDVVAEHNAEPLQRSTPYAGVPDAPTDWFKRVDQARPFFIAGGARINIDGHAALIEVGTRGDPDRQRYWALWLDFVDDVWLPVIPTILLMAGFSILSIRHALQPLEAASAFADAIVPGAPDGLQSEIPLAGMPCEAARFGEAINRLLLRVAELTTAQRLLVRRAAHCLRTPLAIMQLELGKISDPSARRIEDDVTAMGELIGRVMFLARLDEGAALERSLVDLPSVVEEARIILRPVIDERRIQITTQDLGGAELIGHAPAIHQAVLDLIENACRHTPIGSRVTITTGPGAQVCVDDDGPGVAGLDLASILLPFSHGSGPIEQAGLGLAIVDKTALLHGGKIEVATSPMGGARFRLILDKGIRG